MPTKKSAGKPPKKEPSEPPTPKADTELEGKTFDWRGITLALPADPPGDLLFAAEEFGDRPTGLVNAFVGSEQYAVIRSKITKDGLSLEQAFEEIATLADGLTKLYGLGRGESSASQDS